MRDDLLKAMAFRHATKLFDDGRSIARDDLQYILEAARLSPSSLGLEPWRFIVIEDRELRRHLRPACWNQSQITTASVVIAILALKAELTPDSGYARKMLRRLVTDQELDEAIAIYHQIAHGPQLVAWSIAQCHIAAANMMTAAAFIGIDSCPMGGFEAEGVAAVLDIDRARLEPALFLALGYRAAPAPPKQRLSLTELVTYR